MVMVGVDGSSLEVHLSTEHD